MLSFVADLLLTYFCFNLTKDIIIPICCCVYPDSSLKKKFEEISRLLTRPFEPTIEIYCPKILAPPPALAIKETKPVLKEEMSDAA